MAFFFYNYILYTDDFFFHVVYCTHEAHSRQDGNRRIVKSLIEWRLKQGNFELVFRLFSLLRFLPDLNNPISLLRP